MKHQLTALLAAATLTIAAAIGLTGDPAGAHNYSNQTLWTCAATRPSAAWTIDHSWPIYVVPSHLGVRCIGHNSLYGWCWDSDLNTDTGVMVRIGGPWDASVCD